MHGEATKRWDFRIWRQKEIKSAIIGVSSGLIVTCAGALTTWYLHTPHNPPIVLEEFAINSSDSFYQECGPPDYCDLGLGDDRPAAKEPKIYRPTEVWDNAENLARSDFGPHDSLSADATERDFEIKFLKDPSYFTDRFSPVFDVVLNNTGTDSVVLTDIGYVEQSAEEEGGDEQDTASSGLMKVLHRYNLILAPAVSFPYTVTQTADPPLVLGPKHAVRFQVAFVCNEESGLTDYSLTLLHFGRNKALETRQIYLTC